MKAFITGGSGFIGSRLARHLLASGAEVTVYDNFHPQAHANNPENRASLEATAVKVIEGDVRDAPALQHALAQSGADVVYHLAAETGTGQSFDLPARYTDVNVMGTAHLIEAVRAVGGVKRILLAGSRSVYGEGACLDTNGQLTPAVERSIADLTAKDFNPKDAQGNSLTPCATNASCVVSPASIYASTKLMQEYLLQQAFWGSDVEVGILRLQNVYGPGQSLNNPYTGVLSIFCRQIQEGRVLNIFEDGEITRDFVLVDDVVNAFAMIGRATEMPRAIIDIGSGEGATILDVARRLLAMFGESPEKLTITGAFRPGDIRYAVADITAAKTKLGWAPKADLEQGLSQLVEWSRVSMSAQG